MRFLRKEAAPVPKAPTPADILLQELFERSRLAGHPLTTEVRLCTPIFGFELRSARNNPARQDNIVGHARHLGYHFMGNTDKKRPFGYHRGRTDGFYYERAESPVLGWVVERAINNPVAKLPKHHGAREGRIAGKHDPAIVTVEGLVYPNFVSVPGLPGYDVATHLSVPLSATFEGQRDIGERGKLQVVNAIRASLR